MLFRCRVTGENVDLSQCGQGADKEGEEKPAGVSDETMENHALTFLLFSFFKLIIFRMALRPLLRRRTRKLR